MPSENLKMAYEIACDFALRLFAPRSENAFLATNPAAQDAIKTKVEAAVTTQNKTMSWSVFFGGGAVVIGAVAGIFAIVGWYISWQEGNAKDDAATSLAEKNRAKFVELETRLSDSRTEQAKAEIKLEELRKAQAPRYLALGSFFANGAFANLMSGKATSDVEILYPSDDEEAFFLAASVFADLGKLTWNVVRFTTFSEADVLPHQREPISRIIPLQMRVGGTNSGINLVTKVSGNGNQRAAQVAALKDALTTCGVTVSETSNGELSPDLVRVVVGKKP